MKKIFVSLFAGIILVSVLSSCAASKKDCQGRKHYRLNNGIYL
jgi:hypothetical protein